MKRIKDCSSGWRATAAMHCGGSPIGLTVLNKRKTADGDTVLSVESAQGGLLVQGSLEIEEPSLQRIRHGTGSIAGIQLGQDITHMTFDRVSLGERIVRGVSRQFAGHIGGNAALFGVHGPDSVEQFPPQRGFQQVSQCACL
jgi:hypothetical protein